VAAAENYPADLKYHSEHDWARIEGAEAVFGITWKAQDMLGELVFFQPPTVGATVAKDGAYGEIESVKAVSDLVAPLSGKVVQVNDKLKSAPETINDDPYGEGWLVRIELADPAEADALLDVEAYKQLLVEE
jgi:glycine cleavage system H protein